MDFSQLKTIYPNAKVSDQASSDASMLSYSYKNKWIVIPDQNLSQKEKQLLSILLEDSSEDFLPTESKWFAYLMEEQATPPTSSASVRLIQLYLDKKDDSFDERLWLESVRSLLDPVQDAFFMEENRSFIIQDKESSFYTHDEIHGILQTLEEDFSVRTICYIGQYWRVDEKLRELLLEEQAIFKEEYRHLNDRVTSLPDVALRYFTKKALSQSSVMTQLKEHLEEEDDWKDSIVALWESQGNVSVAAKSLFIHRNTLQYRMDKFHQQTGLSLKNMNELLLCYVLTL